MIKVSWSVQLSTVILPTWNMKICFCDRMIVQLFRTIASKTYRMRRIAFRVWFAHDLLDDLPIVSQRIKHPTSGIMTTYISFIICFDQILERSTITSKSMRIISMKLLTSLGNFLWQSSVLSQLTYPAFFWPPVKVILGIKINKITLRPCKETE